MKFLEKRNVRPPGALGVRYSQLSLESTATFTPTSRYRRAKIAHASKSGFKFSLNERPLRLVIFHSQFMSPIFHGVIKCPPTVPPPSHAALSLLFRIVASPKKINAIFFFFLFSFSSFMFSFWHHVPAKLNVCLSIKLMHPLIYKRRALLLSETWWTCTPVY